MIECENKQNETIEIAENLRYIILQRLCRLSDEQIRQFIEKITPLLDEEPEHTRTTGQKEVCNHETGKHDSDRVL